VKKPKCEYFSLSFLIKNSRFNHALIKFLRNPEKLFSYSLYTKNLGEARPDISQEYIFPVHSNMNLKRFK